MGLISPATLKAEARQHFRSTRLAMTAEERLRASEGLRHRVLDWLPSQVVPGHAGLVAAYLSMEPEPGTAELLESLTQRGYEVVIPICEPAYQLSWCRWHPGVELRRSGRAQLFEPVGKRRHFTELLDGSGNFSLVLVPGLAVDLGGSRLGQGGGYYDRFLAQLRDVAPSVPAAAYIYDHELLPEDALPTTPLDVPLTGAFTPTAFHRLKAGRAAV